MEVQGKKFDKVESEYNKKFTDLIEEYCKATNRGKFYKQFMLFIATISEDDLAEMKTEYCGWISLWAQDSNCFLNDIDEILKSKELEEQQQKNRAQAEKRIEEKGKKK